MKLVLVAQSCLTLCNPTDCRSPASSVHGILQARILEWPLTIPFSRGSSQPRDQTWGSCIAGRFFIVWATGKTLSRPKSFLSLEVIQESVIWHLMTIESNWRKAVPRFGTHRTLLLESVTEVSQKWFKWRFVSLVR